MENNLKVFSSNITFGEKPLKNDLTDLLNIVHAEPIIPKRNERHVDCDFTPKCDKHFESKRKSRLKVCTVRDIRNLFERDVLSSLPIELEKQQNILLRKIRNGSSRDKHTKTLARNMLKSDKPISRSAWQMLINLNPEEHAHSTQFVLYDGRCVQVNGSKGGKHKFLCKYDLKGKKLPLKYKSNFKRMTKRKGLLQNSLNVKFKPGPLTRKKTLDESYQKYHVGKADLVKLPTPALEILPTIGKPLDPTLATFVHNMREKDGTITDKWAEFSLSVLATPKNSDIIQVAGDSYVTFDLYYKCNQRRILMRRDVENYLHNTAAISNTIDPCILPPEENDVTPEVRVILNDMINSVIINTEQDNMYTGQDDPRETSPEESNTATLNNHSKDKFKRKRGELGRLDVTIIRLSENSENELGITCRKAFCKLGCVCASLECSYHLKRHCGRADCMLSCKCDFSKYKVYDSYERDCSELLPGLLHLDNELNSKMAKEEQEFHQTVIVTSEKSMILKSKKRNWKSSKKYADFYSSMCLKSERKVNSVSIVLMEKINCDNIEPWCMVHNLYKCFCKGRFSSEIISNLKVDDSCQVIMIENDNVQNNEKLVDENQELLVRKSSRKRVYSPGNNFTEKIPCDQSASLGYDEISARTVPYVGRKYNDEYYVNANKRISEMEEHDNKLRKRMLFLINECANKITLIPEKKMKVIESVSLLDTEESLITMKSNETDSLAIPTTLSDNDISEATSFTTNNNKQTAIVLKTNALNKRLPNKVKLVSWLESSYKHYKQRLDQGIVKMSLDPPKQGKMALYPWNFILNRYRERKNLFMVSKQLPYRIFMAVDSKNSFFDNCININEIRYADLHKYPITVKNLLANAKDLKDNFCILCGLSHCWELIGSVTKVSENQDEINTEKVETCDDDHDISDTNYFESEDSNAAIDTELKTDSGTAPTEETDVDCSKWFVMTIEKDFNEIQFYSKGFFVKFESIVKAINVARASGKTVRLSSHKCADKDNGPQFGIYAIPNENENCVFIGPYDKEEPLGIEIMRNFADLKKCRSRGVWISTKKLDNFKVIDNPLSYMPSTDIVQTDLLTLMGKHLEETQETSTTTKQQVVSIRSLLTGGSVSQHLEGSQVVQNISSVKKTTNTGSVKIIKPIKISKTNGFYQFASNGLLKPIPQQQIHLHGTLSIDDVIRPLTPCKANITETTRTDSSLLQSAINEPILNIEDLDSATLTRISKKPVAEIAPHVKHTAASVIPIPNDSKKKDRGMFILKPEEINQRLDQLVADSQQSAEQTIEMDIENFLATVEECAPPNNDIFIISDDDTDNEDCYVEKRTSFWKDVWIECKNIDNFGWIRGRQNNEKFLSFEFPGFKFTEFYTEEEAFAKLNQVLSRKIYIPKNIQLEWQVIESERDLRAAFMLKLEHMGPDFVVTKRGIRHKKDISSKAKAFFSPKIEQQDLEVANREIKSESNANNDPKDLIKGLEEESKLLEDERQILWNKLTNKMDITDASNDLRQEIADRLKSLMSDT